VVIAGNEAVRLAERASVTEIESLNGISGEVVTALDSIKRAIQDVSEYVNSAGTYEGRVERTRRARKPGRNLL
jgi:hypothetical protein